MNHFYNFIFYITIALAEQGEKSTNKGLFLFPEKLIPISFIYHNTICPSIKTP